MSLSINPGATALQVIPREPSSLATDIVIPRRPAFDAEYHSLFRNRGTFPFEDATVQSGLARITRRYVGWGAHFLDYDNDGTMDLMIASICISNSAKLLSRNMIDFSKVPNLQVEDWLR